MKNDYWSTSKSISKIEVSSRLPKSPAFGYFNPDMRKVSVVVENDEEDFIPAYSSGSDYADLLANIPEGELNFPEGSFKIIDCGVGLELPAGYRCRVSSHISNLFVELTDSKRLKLKVFNAGEKVRLIHKQKIAKIWVEPVYLFEWITKG